LRKSKKGLLLRSPKKAYHYLLRIYNMGHIKKMWLIKCHILTIFG
jgi:hypothetical protein